MSTHWGQFLLIKEKKKGGGKKEILSSIGGKLVVASMRLWTCILKQPCDASWVKHVKGHLTSIPNRRTRWEIRSISMKPRPVLDWSITKLHLPLMRVSFDRCPRALISDSFSWPMFPCSRVLRVLLRVLLYRDILWKREGKKRGKKSGMKNWNFSNGKKFNRNW